MFIKVNIRANCYQNSMYHWALLYTSYGIDERYCLLRLLCVTWRATGGGYSLFHPLF